MGVKFVLKINDTQFDDLKYVFTPFESSEVVKVNIFLQDLTLMCIDQNQCQYLFPQKTSFYCGFVNHDFGLNLD